jgi:hypothetical protein
MVKRGPSALCTADYKLSDGSKYPRASIIDEIHLQHPALPERAQRVRQGGRVKRGRRVHRLTDHTVKSKARPERVSSAAFPRKRLQPVVTVRVKDHLPRAWPGSESVPDTVQ